MTVTHGHLHSTLKKPPNFLVIMTDQHRADHLGCAGNGIVKTPHIDRLAAGGRMFKRFYVSTPICMPNRATFFTGRLPSLHGAHCNGAPLDRRANTFTWMLKGAGYNTELVGKVHLQNMTAQPATMQKIVQPGLPPQPGFDEALQNMFADGRYDQESTALWANDPGHGLDLPYYGFDKVSLCTMHGDVVGGEYARWLRAECPNAAQLIGPANASPDPRYSVPQAYRTQLPEKLYPTTWVEQNAKDALRRLSKESEKPFFLMVSFPDPHHPFTPPGKYWDMYDPDKIDAPLSLYGEPGNPAIAALREARRSGRTNTQGTMPIAISEREAREATALTYGMISMIDDCVGGLLATLQEVGASHDTVVIFTSDHGDFMGDHGLMLKSVLHYQSLVRVPFIWWEHGLNAPGFATDALHSTLDVGRTVLSRAGVQPFWGMQGHEMNSSLSDPRAPGSDAVLVEEDGHEICAGFDRPVRVRTLVTSRWRLSIYDGQSWGELYDLKDDPHELNNRFDDPTAGPIRAELFERLAYLQMEQADRSPYPMGRA
jgi:arylsulfatase A-like enzyme